MRFSICVIEPGWYKYSHFLYDVTRYLCFSIESAGHECCILRNKLSSDRVNIVVGAHNETDPGILKKIKQTGNYILAQSEIITGDSINNWADQKSFAEVYLPLMRQAKAVWTGIETNVEALKKLGVEADHILMGYHPLMEEIHHKQRKDIDFLFCGSITPHRKKLLDGLIKRGANVVTMFDDAAMYRNDLIARARINLAPNQGPDMDHFSGSRIAYLVNNRSIVVVERCRDQAMYEHCFPWADTEQWVDLCVETLKRPDLHQLTEEYYERFKKIRMVDFVKPLLDKFCAALKSSTPDIAAAKKEQIEPAATDDAGMQCRSKFTKENAIEGMTSIIMLTHNRLDQTKKCVKSIRKHTPELHEIIFVDNGSTDSTVKWLQGQVKENKNYQLIENKENVGVAKGRNLGINISRGESILLLDNDVIISSGWLSGMMECLKHAPDAGIVGPITNSSSGRQQVADESYRSVDYLDKYATTFKERFNHRRIPCRNIAGFCMLFKRTLVEKVGLLDERFGTGHSEAEVFCLRAALKDYQNYIAGDIFVHHSGGKGSLGDRRNLNEKWTLSLLSPEGKKMAVLRVQDMADVIYSKGNADQAVEALINCIKLTPDAKEIYYQLARIFIESKRFSEAQEVIDTMPEAAKKELTALESAGYTKEGLGLDDEAASYVDKMLSLDGKCPAALNLRGVLEFKKGEKDKAQDYFNKAINADPGYGEAYTNLGVLCWGMDKKEEALAHLKKGIVLSPTVPDVSSLYYSVVSSLGIFSDAEADFREACRLYPNNKNLAFLHIDMFIQQGKFDLAILKIEDVLAMFGLDEATLNAALAVREKLGPLRIENASRKSTLSLCMIVKNEERHLVRCLKSIRDVVDEIIIVDTGSTDKTKDVATIFGAKVFYFPWTGDFAAARNHSLDQATGNWILVLDADEVLSPLDFKEIKEIIRRKPSSPAAYYISTRNYVRNSGLIGWTQNNGEYPEEVGPGWVASIKVRLFTRSKDAFFSSPVHETLESSLEKAKIPITACKIVVHHYGKLDDQKELQKGEDYYLLGKIKYENDPTNMKYVLELARQAHGLNKYEEAVELWLKLISLVLKTDSDSPVYKEFVRNTHGDPLSEINIQLASAYLMLDRYEEALVRARKAMESRKNLKECVYCYAHCEIIAGSLDKAFYALDDLLKTMPDYPPALLLMAVIFCLEGKKEKAQEYFRLLQQKGVQLSLLLNKFAKQLRHQGRKDDALLILNAAVENKLNDEETANLLEALQTGQNDDRLKAEGGSRSPNFQQSREKWTFCEAVKAFNPPGCREAPRPDSD